MIFLLRWLFFRLMLQSALVKWLSGDPLWHHFTALTVHYQTQPLPNPLSWYVHQWPVWFHQMCCAGLFLIEGAFPFFIFAPPRLRFASFWGFLLLQVLILLTGNYTYFNLLAITLSLLLLEDQNLRAWLPVWCDEPIQESRAPARGWGLAAAAVIFLTSVPFARVLGVRLPNWLMSPAFAASPLRSFNSYGLFAVMTPNRPEIILEGSKDGKNWLPYEFLYKPGDLSRRPAQVAPFQPRLDWQMWFAALGDYRQNPWFINACVRLLQGSKPVLTLLKTNPFPDNPPVYLRAMLYEYRFTSSEEHQKTGNWWAREEKGLYCPVLSLKNS